MFIQLEGDKGWRNNTFKFAKTREENKRPATLMQL